MESSGFSGHNWLMIDGSLWARSVAIPLHWEASKDGQIKQTLRWIIFPSRKKKAQKGKLMHWKEERKKVRKKETVFTDIGDLWVFLPERRDRPKLYRKTNTENEKMNFFQVSLYRKLFFDSH